jgi:hypothetical protein
MGSKKSYKRKKMRRAQTTAKAASGMSHNADGHWVNGKSSQTSDASYQNSRAGAAGHQ